MAISGRKAALRVIASAGLLGALAAAAPAQAQVYGVWGYRTWNEPIDRLYEPPVDRYYSRPRVADEADTLTPREVRDLLAYDGFRLNGPLTRRGANFVADVTDRSGVRLRIVLDAFDGAVVRSVALGADLRPPRDIPSARADRTLDLDDEPRIVPGMGPRDTPRKAEPRPEPVRPKVANVPDQKAAAPKRESTKPADKKPAPSQSMTAPSAPGVEKPAGAVAPKPTTTAQRPVRQVYPASGVPAAPISGEPKIELPPPVPVPEITPNPGGAANGVPVNPLE